MNSHAREFPLKFLLQHDLGTTRVQKSAHACVCIKHNKAREFLSPFLGGFLLFFVIYLYIFLCSLFPSLFPLKPIPLPHVCVRIFNSADFARVEFYFENPVHGITAECRGKKKKKTTEQSPKTPKKKRRSRTYHCQKIKQRKTKTSSNGWTGQSTLNLYFLAPKLAKIFVAKFMPKDRRPKLKERGKGNFSFAKIFKENIPHSCKFQL